MNRLILAAAAFGVLSPVLLGQAPATFDAVSIKPYAGSFPLQIKTYVLIVPAAGGMVRGSPTTALPLITQAYWPAVFTDVIGPDWIRTTRFEFLATVGSGMSRDELLAQSPGMMQAMLEDRFKFKAHLETRPTPIYTLVKGRNDGRRGPDLRESSPIDCDAQSKADIEKNIEKQKQVSPADFIAMKTSAGFGRCWTSSGPGRVQGHDITMKALAGLLGIDRPVVDRTGLDGRYDVELHWAPPTAPSPDGTAVVSEGPSVFTALQEQLGLRLEKGEAPMDVLVIDHIEPPTPN